eukprot:GFUD01012036.1.p1 GENE.GFUD01012036.1~~GFUD01012036.1.p1  ORF type:complete len:200 (+),score=51.83 GFUD01012036.1:83-682(+)
MQGFEMAPFRSLDEFLLSQAKFELPELGNPEKWSSRVVSNLLYYQTNYFLAWLLIFLLVCFFSPGKMFFAMLTLAIVFGVQYYLASNHVQVKTWKTNHPTVIMVAASLIASLLLYQFGWIRVFLLGFILPIILAVLHAFLHTKGKVQVAKGHFWKKKKEIEAETQEGTNVDEIPGVSKETPMARVLDEWGIEPDFKFIS